MELIVAVDRSWGIGYKKDLLARVKADLTHFKEVTKGKTVILGSNTLSTFPGGKPLKNRVNLILHPDPAFTVEGALVLHGVDEVLQYVRTHREESFVVIGGASVYRQMLPFCDTAFVTKFDREFEKDAFFPDLDKDPEWRLAFRSETFFSDGTTDTVANMPFTYTVYKRRMPAPLFPEEKEEREATRNL